MKISVTTKFEKDQDVRLTRRPDLGIFKIANITVYPTEEGAGKVSYTLRQTLFQSGAFGFEESFSLRGIDEKEIEAVQVDEVFVDGESITLFNYD